VSHSDGLPAYGYVLYIDEAGDPGLDRVRPMDPVGGSEWLTIGALLVRASNEHAPPTWVGDILRDIGVRQRPDLHFRDLSPTRKKRVCELIASLPAVCFVVCSNKKNMRQHSNRRAEKRGGQQWFYNWCARILIERATQFVVADATRLGRAPEKIRIIFSNRGGHRYSQTQAYHELLKQQSRAQSTYLQKRIPRWEVMDYRLVSSVPHRENAGLQLADVIASAFHTAADNLDTGPCWTEAAEFLAPRMGYERDEMGAKIVRDFGVVLQPTPPWKGSGCIGIDGNEAENGLFAYNECGRSKAEIRRCMPCRRMEQHLAVCQLCLRPDITQISCVDQYR
jgi:hypothetical protein